MFINLNYISISILLVVFTSTNGFPRTNGSSQVNTFEKLVSEIKEDYVLNDEEVSNSFSSYISNKVTFWLYTRESRDDGVKLLPDDSDTLASSNFDDDKQTKIIIHGWLGDGESQRSICTVLKNEYFKLDNYNIICVDWSIVIFDLAYFTARLRCKEVGNYLAELILMLADNTNQKTDNIHIIGFSMGAHIAGYAGKRLDGQLQRITGLDPARPLFSSKRPNERLNENDAKFVDIIHTTSLILGQHKPMGKIDFYPNGGYSRQPTCEYDYVFGEVCSHYKSYEFYARSIRFKDEFKSIKCNEWDDYKKSVCSDDNDYTFMGEYVNSRELLFVSYMSSFQTLTFS